MLLSHNGGGKKKSSKGTNKENLTQSPINGINSIYLLMIKCCRCCLVAKFDDDRHLRKQVDRQQDRYPQLLQPSITSYVLPSLLQPDQLPQ